MTSGWYRGGLGMVKKMGMMCSFNAFGLRIEFFCGVFYVCARCVQGVCKVFERCLKGV